MSSYRGLLVDFGGVLTTSLAESFAAFCIQHQVDPNKLRDVIKVAYEKTHEASQVHLLETGRLGIDEWHDYLAAELSVDRDEPLDPADLTQRLFAGMRPDEAMIEAVQTLKTHGFKTGLLSNSWGDLTYSDQVEHLFDAVVVSGKVGLRKPHADIYIHAAKELDLSPQECVFVDDLDANVKGAERVGMKGVHHVSALQTIGELSELFAVDLSVATR